MWPYPGQSGPGSDGNKGVLCISQSSSITGASPADCAVSYLGNSLGESYSFAEAHPRYSLADWTQWRFYVTRLIRANSSSYKERFAPTPLCFFYLYIFIRIYIYIYIYIYICIYIYILVGWLVGWVLWHINLCWLFNTKWIFMQIVSSIENNSI